MGPIGWLVLGSVLISFSPVFVLLSHQSPTLVALLRMGMGGLILLPVYGRSLFAVQTRPALRGAAGWLFLAGGAFAFDLISWHTAIQYIGSGVATVLGNTQIFYVIVLSYWLYGERLDRRFLFWATVAIVATAGLLTSTTRAGYLMSRPATEVRWGILCGVLTGPAYAAYLLALKHVQRRHRLTAPITQLVTSLTTTVVLLAVDLVSHRSVLQMGAIKPMEWFWLLCLALVVHVIGWLIITSSLPLVPGGTSSMILVLQPVLSTVWGSILFAENLSLGQALTIVLIVGAIIGTQRARGR
jgi:drug/metabolite transporter (DMT)-like permease